MQKTGFSRKKIKPFIQNYHINTEDFLNSVDSFHSFNDFFIRKLRPDSRPIHSGQNIAVLPADARYLVYENLNTTEGFFVKGMNFCLDTLLKDKELAKQYQHASMVIARLAPVDYHRFHFPIDCIPSKAQEIKGKLFSVNPKALKKNIHILTENKRMITHLESEKFGTILFIEVGATYVGTIHQTFTPNQFQSKGSEKGYFSFGGSCILMLFKEGKIQFDSDLIEASKKRIEILGHLGQSLGHLRS